MKEIVNNLNTPTLTAYVASAKNSAVFVRATRKEAEEVIAHQHIDIVLKNVFSGASEMRTIPVEEYKLELDDLKSIKSNPFGIYVPLGGEWAPFCPEDIVDILPKGWKYDDPCITTYAPGEEMTWDDYIINLRTKQLVYFFYHDEPMTKISDREYPKVSGEAQLIFSMFINNTNSEGLLSLYMRPVPKGILWYEELGKDVKGATSFFSDKSPTIEEQQRSILKCFENTLLEIESSDSVIPINGTSICIADARDMYAYIYICNKQKEESENNLNTPTFTTWVASAKNTAVVIRLTKEEAERVVGNQNLNLILKNVFSGTSEMKTIQIREDELNIDDIKTWGPEPFGLCIPLLEGWAHPENIINLLPEGWKPDDPCITTYDSYYAEMTLDDYIINLRTGEIIFFMKPTYVTKIYRTSDGDYPKVSGEAQAIFSMFLENTPTDFLMFLYKAPVPSDIAWYEEFVKENVGNTTSFFSENAPLKTRASDSITPERHYAAIDLMGVTTGLYEYFRKRVRDRVE